MPSFFDERDFAANGIIPLVDIGYAGPVTVEPFSKRLNAMAPFDAARATAAALKSVWP